MKRLKGLMILALAAALCAVLPITAQAKKTKETGSVYLRARLDYTASKGMTALSEDNIILASGKWKADGDYYYYDSPVEPGQTVDFISGVRIPEEWGNTATGNQFSILVTAEAAESLPGTTGWNSNQETIYSTTFDVMKGEQKKLGYKVKKGTITLSIKEYEVDESGKLKTYENNKIVVPGEEVSKVVKITVNGDKTTRTKKEKDTEPSTEKKPDPVTPLGNNPTPNGGTGTGTPAGNGDAGANGNWDGKVVRTGDSSKIGAAVIGIIACSAGIIGITAIQRRRRKKLS